MKLRSRVVHPPSTRSSPKRYWLRRMTIMYDINVHGTHGCQDEVIRGSRADWDPETTDTFCRWAAQAADQKLTQGGTLSKAGWTYIMKGFQEETGRSYTRVQIKNKWRQLRKLYKETKALLGSMTGLGWDHERGTILADNDWWEACIQVCPEAASLMGKRIPNLGDMERMFASVRDLSGFGWSSQMGGNPCIPNLNGDFAALSDDEDFPETSTHEPTQYVPTGLTHQGNDARGVGTQGFRNHATPPGRGNHAAGTMNNPIGRMSETAERSSQASRQRKRKSGEEERTEILSRMCDYLTTGQKEQWKEIAEAMNDRDDMGTVMAAVAALPGLTAGDPTWMAASDYFLENEKAIPLFLCGCGSPEVQLQWLRYQLEKRGVNLRCLIDSIKVNILKNIMPPLLQRLKRLVISTIVAENDDVVAGAMVQEFLAETATSSQVGRRPNREPIQTGEQLFWKLTKRPDEFFDEYRMTVTCFWELHDTLVQHYGLQGSTNITSYEALAIFLSLCGHGDTQRRLGRWYEHSASTINTWYKVVLDAVCKMSEKVIRPADLTFSTVPTYVISKCPQFYNAIGAIDGTHIPAIVETEEIRNYYIGRKGEPTQNVPVAYDFDMRFTFVYAGTPGSQHDMAVLQNSMTNPSSGFPFPPPGKYYLVDSGYANSSGFFAPFRTVPYHPSDFNGRSPRGMEQKFNFVHASLRNIIERTIGVWKKKWKILRLMHEFDAEIQVKLVVATAALHNFIRTHNIDDEDITAALHQQYTQHDAAADDPLPFNELHLDGHEMATVRNEIARTLHQGASMRRSRSRHSVS